MNRVRPWPPDLFTIGWPDTARLVVVLRSAAPTVLFGLRFWAAVCLALYVAFWLELDNAAWAGASAAIVSQPSLGASLRKGWFRMVGTVIGAVAIVVLTALFVQSRAGFLLSLALWGAGCAVLATVLRNFAAYSAALAGYTAAIIASDELGAVGGATGDVLLLAITRASEIGIGIVCAVIVMTGTSLGGASRRLAAQLATLATEIMEGLTKTLSLAGAELSAMRTVRRDLVRRVIALEPLMEDVIGESSELRYRAPQLYAARDGLFAALGRWQMAAVHLERLGSHRAGDADPIQRRLPGDERPPVDGDDTPNRAAELLRLRAAYTDSIRALLALPNRTPSRQLLADQAARALIAIRRVIDGLMLLTNPGQACRRGRTSWFSVPDPLPVVVGALRVFLAIAAIELFWIATAWPNGPQAIVFVAIVVILFSSRPDMVQTRDVAAGIALSVVCAMVVNFALLPGLTTFVGMSLALGVVLVPVGMLLIMGWRPSLVLIMAATFVSLLSPANQMTYNTTQFYNVALGIVAGTSTALLSFHLVPPLSPAVRTRRLLMLTLRDLRRLAAGVRPQTADDWRRRILARLTQLPEQAEPVQRAQLTAALSVGTEIIRLRRFATPRDRETEFAAAMASIAEGRSAAAAAHLTLLDQELAAQPHATAGAWLRARGSILAVSEALEQHAGYFDPAGPQ
jgi:uncharacterized membrane protein YccC